MSRMNTRITWKVDAQGNWQRADLDATRPDASAGAPRQNAGPTHEVAHADWRKRLVGNLSRPSHREWDPLTYVADGPRER